MTHAEIPLLLFAKAPIAGKVKTRLTSHCTEHQAAEIARLLINASIEKAVSAWPGRVVLSVWLDHEHSFFKKMLARYPITMQQQCCGDLGAKMQHALKRVGYPSAVMGCDAPHVDPLTLSHAHQELADGRAVIGPAADGGYYLLGLTADADFLFQNKPWGTERVMPETLIAANRAGLSLHQLARLNDIDEWADVLELAKFQPDIADYLINERLV